MHLFHPQENPQPSMPNCVTMRNLPVMKTLVTNYPKRKRNEAQIFTRRRWAGMGSRSRGSGRGTAHLTVRTHAEHWRRAAPRHAPAPAPALGSHRRTSHIPATPQHPTPNNTRTIRPNDITRSLADHAIFFKRTIIIIITLYKHSSEMPFVYFQQSTPDIFIFMKSTLYIIRFRSQNWNLINGNCLII